MSDTKRFDDYNNEKKVHRINKTKKNRLDKHKKLIYDVVSHKRKEDNEIDEVLDYGSFTKIKRR